MTAPSRDDAATIVEFAASLGPMLQTEDLPARVRTALTTIFQHGLAYAETGDPKDKRAVDAANDALRKLIPARGADMSTDARRAVLRGYEVASAVRAAADPPAPVDAMDVFDAIDRAAAEECGITVAEYRADDDEFAGRWRTRMPVTVIGVDTDTPTLAGLDHLSVVQLRHIHHQVARLINAKTPPPPSHRAPGRVAAEDSALPLRYSGQQVA